jgi:hypothetical protein
MTTLNFFSRARRKVPLTPLTPLFQGEAPETWTADELRAALAAGAKHAETELSIRLAMARLHLKDRKELDPHWKRIGRLVRPVSEHVSPGETHQQPGLQIGREPTTGLMPNGDKK